MADYYSQTTLREVVLLTDELVSALKARGADLGPEGEQESVLDGIVNERPPLSRFTVVWSEGWTHACEDVDEFLVEYVGWDEADVEKASPEFRRLVVLPEEDLLHEILKLNPDIELLEMNEAWTCSKMRLDGFGGRSLVVNRKGYLHIGTGRYHVDEDDVICPDNAFKFWADEN